MHKIYSRSIYINELINIFNIQNKYNINFDQLSNHIKIVYFD